MLTSKFYSRTEFFNLMEQQGINDLTVKNSSDFFIGINPTGGPYVESYFKDKHFNVLNVYFDDTDVDKESYDHIDNLHYVAYAPNKQHIEEIFDFIVKSYISNPDATVHVYCTRGESRSKAVSDFINQTPDWSVENDGRSHNFIRDTLHEFKKSPFVIRSIDLSIDVNEFQNYYNEVSKKYQHLKWTADKLNDVVDSDKHSLNGFYGWGIQSNLKDLTEPCPPFNVHKNGSDDYRNTKLAFGVIKQLQQYFPLSRQFSISCQPPGARIAEHIDSTQYWKIHIPITTNPNMFFTFGDYKVNLKVGKAYLINTSIMHGTENLGDTERVHIFFKVPALNI